ncbi:hypothetical protein [Aliiruegeria lutimaris]|uniref:hypothetical protein n=1 Tax=Aliiruegeria lutimaris TaxID=571298 RepID=UPI000B8420FB|nr:hypothetical protein [Aliiruegeria lutimaris]
MPTPEKENPQPGYRSGVFGISDLLEFYPKPMALTRIEDIDSMKSSQIKLLMRRFGLTEAQARLIATLAWGGAA